MPHQSNEATGRAPKGSDCHLPSFMDKDIEKNQGYHGDHGYDGDHHGVQDLTNSMLSCCSPLGCSHQNDNLIDPNNPIDAVKVWCNNESCDQGNWMHQTCFMQWEQHVLTFLKSCGRARSWSDKQRLQNLWTKKGYDLAFKVCACKCGRGHIRKDLNYIPSCKLDYARPKRNKKKSGERVLPQLPKNNNYIGVVTHNPVITNGAITGKARSRFRTSSISSTGSSPSSTEGTPPMLSPKSKFEFFADSAQAAAGNIFRQRTDFAVFNVLPRYLQNAYHIKMEDEGPHGNDDTRSFVLTSLSTHKITSMCCATCHIDMPVFDKYPLIDGTFFLSPQNYDSDVQVLFQQKMLYLNAICMHCLTGYREEIRCKGCHSQWVGIIFVIGTMYSYDIFAAMPCCEQRLACKSCKRPILEPEVSLNFFSEYSKILKCPHCNVADHHFIKPLIDVYGNIYNSSTFHVPHISLHN